jgi:hypothetical protein
MTPKLTAALVAAALVMLSACSNSDAKQHHVTPIAPAYDATVLAGQAKGEVIVIGTLATIGSFEYGNASLATVAAAALKHIPQLLHDHQISTDEAQKKINAAVTVRDLLKKANTVCKQNGAGKCTGNQAQAEALADQARAVMARSGLN